MKEKIEKIKQFVSKKISILKQNFENNNNFNNCYDKIKRCGEMTIDISKHTKKTDKYDSIDFDLNNFNFYLNEKQVDFTIVIDEIEKTIIDIKKNGNEIEKKGKLKGDMYNYETDRLVFLIEIQKLFNELVKFLEIIDNN